MALWTFARYCAKIISQLLHILKGYNMLNQKYLDMTSKESVIRKIFMYGMERSKVIGYENLFDYSLGNPSVAPPKSFDEALLDIIKNENPIAIHGYSPNAGNSLARQAIADDLNKRFGCSYTINNIFMTSGAAGAVSHALRAVITPDNNEEVITFAPHFPEYAPYVDGSHAKLVVVPADTTTFQINFDAFLSLINEHTKAILINSPNNPSGIVYTTETIQRLSEILLAKEKEYGHTIYLISDEPYREILFKGTDAPFIASYYHNTVICYSYSKSLSIPGERIGYLAVTNECDDYADFVNVCVQISRFTGHNCPPSLIQLAVAKTAGDTSVLSVYEENKNILYRELTAMGFSCVEPGGTFYMFPQALIPDANAFCEKAKEFDLLLVPSDSFGCTGHFRIAYCVPTEKVIRSLEAFRKLADFYKN